VLPEVREKFEKAWEKKEKELLAKGYPRPLVEKAKEYAEEYIQGTTEEKYHEAPRWFLAKTQEYAIDDALRYAEEYVRGMFGFAGKVAEAL